jgi:hypothetical protein
MLSDGTRSLPHARAHERARLVAREDPETDQELVERKGQLASSPPHGGCTARPSSGLLRGAPFIS